MIPVLMIVGGAVFTAGLLLPGTKSPKNAQALPSNAPEPLPPTAPANAIPNPTDPLPGAPPTA